MDWDDKMQIECANSFVKPLENNVKFHKFYHRDHS